MKSGTHASWWLNVKRAAAFTLVELLVVIAIVGILMALLIPAISRVQAQAKTAECMSNLKQIGMAAQQYSLRFTDYTVPGYYCMEAEMEWGDFPVLPGESAVIYCDKENYASILCYEGLLSSPIIQGSSFASPSSAAPNTAFPINQRSVFKCPEGIDDGSFFRYDPSVNYKTSPPAAWTKAADRTAGAFRVPWRVDSVMMNGGIDTWYGINANDVGMSVNLAMPNPCSRLPDQYRTAYQSVNIRATAQVQSPSNTVFLFDGISDLGGMFSNASPNTSVPLNTKLSGITSTNVNPSISMRHNGGKSTNLLFFDGHVETDFSSQLALQKGTACDIPPTFDLATVTKVVSGVSLYPKYRWRADQP